jgi:hypothetical protein
MPNTNTPFGLRPKSYIKGAPWNGQARMYFIPASNTSAFAIGDPVVVAAAGGDAAGVPGIVLATPGSGITGVVVSAGGPKFAGMAADPLNLNTTVIPATKTRDYYVMVCDDPDVIFEVQEVAGGTQLAAADVGLNANLVAGTNNGYMSGWQLTNSTEATTATLDVKLLGLAQRPGNEFGAWAKWDVLINNHTFRGGVTGV